MPNTAASSNFICRSISTCRTAASTIRIERFCTSSPARRASLRAFSSLSFVSIISLYRVGLEVMTGYSEIGSHGRKWIMSGGRRSPNTTYSSRYKGITEPIDPYTGCPTTWMAGFLMSTHIHGGYAGWQPQKHKRTPDRDQVNPDSSRRANHAA